MNWPQELQTSYVIAISEGHAFLLETDDGHTTKKTYSVIFLLQEVIDMRVIIIPNHTQEQVYKCT